jgi:hypothetical protein
MQLVHGDDGVNSSSSALLLCYSIAAWRDNDQCHRVCGVAVIATRPEQLNMMAVFTVGCVRQHRLALPCSTWSVHL